MIRAERIWKLQRLTGFVAMVLLGLALLCVFDGLRDGFLGSSGQIRLISGEQYLLSGPLPPKTDRIEDFIIEGAAADGSVRLVPIGIFTGFMFGGGMWRGHLDVDTHAKAGSYEIRVRDRFGEKQNPALIFNVRVFADAQERQASSPSVVMRWISLDPRIVAACLGVLGILVGCTNFLLGRKWHSLLVEHGCGEVYRFKVVDDRLEVTADMGHTMDFPPGTIFRFTHPVRGELGQGAVISCERGKITLHVSPEVSVRPGDIACPAHV